MMNNKELAVAVAGIGSQTRGGISLSDAVLRMARIQPKYADFWTDSAYALEHGKRFSDCVREMWPEALHSAVLAAEKSGTMDNTLLRIEHVLALQEEVNDKIGKIKYPGFIALAAIGVFFFFMIAVIPALAESLGTGAKSVIFTSAMWMKKMAYNHWLPITGGVAILVMSIVMWLRDPENRASLIDFFLTVPVIGPAMKMLYFGMWANYMALMDMSGSIDTPQGLQLTVGVLPTPLRDGVILMSEQVVTMGLANAADPAKLDEDDPRQEWPFYITNAFLIGQQTGLLGDALLKAAPSMIKEGTKKLTMAIDVMTYTVMGIAAGMIGVPLMAYYAQMGTALQEAFK
jgi:type II secretory pathway component PulF